MLNISIARISTFMGITLLLGSFFTACNFPGPSSTKPQDPVATNFHENTTPNAFGLKSFDEAQIPSSLLSYRVHTSRQKGIDTHPEVYNDGETTFLYFASDRDGSGFNIYRKGSESKALTMLTDFSGDEMWPRVSPNGRYLTFGANTRGNWDIFLIDLHNLSLPAVALTSSSSDEIHPTWSPDSMSIVYSRWSENLDDYVLNYLDFSNYPTSTKPKLEKSWQENVSHKQTNLGLSHQSYSLISSFAELPNQQDKSQDSPLKSKSGYPKIVKQGQLVSNQGRPLTGIHPSFAPDSSKKRLAYQDYRKSGANWYGIRLYDCESGIVTFLPTSENYGAIQPRWSPMGDMIIFTTVSKTHNRDGQVLPAGGDGFGILSTNGNMVFDIRNPTDIGFVADPTWVVYRGEQRIFFAANSSSQESIVSISLGKRNF